LDPMLSLWIIGAAIVAIALILIALKQAVGRLILLVGGLWVATMIIYQILVATGTYGKPPAEIGYVTNAVGVLILIGGIVYYLRTIRSAGVRR